jgi:hypothetical protein
VSLLEPRSHSFVAPPCALQLQESWLPGREPLAGRGPLFNATLREVEVVNSAWFCAEPPDDQLSRSALFDCLAAGAAPVAFEKGAPDAMPFADIVDWRYPPPRAGAMGSRTPIMYSYSRIGILWASVTFLRARNAS